MRDPLDRGRSGAGSCRLNKQEAIGPWKHPFCASVWSMASLMNDLPPSSARAALVVIVISRICKAPSVDGHPATLHWPVHGFWASSERRTLNIARKRLTSPFCPFFFLLFISHSKEWYFYQNLQSQPKITKPFERSKDFNICRTSVKKKHGARFSSQNQLGSPVKENIVSSFLQKLYVRTEETIPDE